MIFALTGPSGSGKTTYSKMLLEKYNDIAVSSHTVTTRLAREGKDESRQYTFVSKQEFIEMKKQKLFACQTEFCGNFYGITKAFISKTIKDGKILILDSIQNPSEVRKLHKHAVVVFLSATKAETEARIRRRSKMDDKEVGERLEDFDRQQKLINVCTHEVSTSSETTEGQVFDQLVQLFEEHMVSAKSVCKS